MHSVTAHHIANLWQTKIMNLLTSNLENQLVFIGMEFGVCVRGYSRNRGWVKCNGIIEKPTPTWLTVHKSSLGKALCMTGRQLDNGQVGESPSPPFLVSLLPSTYELLLWQFSWPWWSPEASAFLDMLGWFASWVSRASLLLLGGNVPILRKLPYGTDPIVSLCNKAVDAF